MKFLFYIVLLIVAIMFAFVIVGTIQPRGYLERAKKIPSYLFKTKILKRKGLSLPPTCNYGKSHWSKPKGFTTDITGYLSESSVFDFAKADKQFYENLHKDA